MYNLESLPINDKDAGIYIHFPYCDHKCPYCDFNSHVQSHDDDGYAKTILEELDIQKEFLHVPNKGLTSIYFGGGTPSLWSPKAVGHVISTINRYWKFSDNIEITLEANPGTTSYERFQGYVDHGVNRFSIGCQSFDDNELQGLGRIHNAEQSIKAVQDAQKTQAAVSLDLIYGLPGQSKQQAHDSILKAVQLGPDHISAYTLTIEPNTIFGRKTRLGLFKPMPDDSQAALIESVSQTLDSHGYKRYEISNYARNNAIARHNTLYWVGAAYLGLGAGAHSYLPSPDLLTGIRKENERLPSRYNATALPRFEERLDHAQIVADRLMVALRVAFAFDPLDFCQRVFKPELANALTASLMQLVHRGFLIESKGKFLLTAQGFLFNDEIARELMHIEQK